MGESRYFSLARDMSSLYSARALPWCYSRFFSHCATYFQAALLKSFGFGQAGAEILIVHPDFLMAALSPSARMHYQERRKGREANTLAYHQGVLTGKHTMVQVGFQPIFGMAFCACGSYSLFFMLM